MNFYDQCKTAGAAAGALGALWKFGAYIVGKVGQVITRELKTLEEKQKTQADEAEHRISTQISGVNTRLIKVETLVDSHQQRLNAQELKNATIVNGLERH